MMQLWFERFYVPVYTKQVPPPTHPAQACFLSSCCLARTVMAFIQICGVLVHESERVGEGQRNSVCGTASQTAQQPRPVPSCTSSQELTVQIDNGKNMRIFMLN